MNKFISQPQRMGARTQSRNTLGIDHPFAESHPVARMILSMVPGGGPVSGYTQEDIATLQLPEEIPLFSPLGYDITDKDLAKVGLATDAMDFLPGAAIVGGMATGAGLLGRALKSKNYVPTSTEDVASVLLASALQRRGLLNEAMVGGEAGAAALARVGNTAPQQAMELAEQMESAGRSRDEIWAATAELGYPVFRGKDGKLRFEIDDSAARTRGVDEPKVTRGAIWKSEDAIEHPEFYDMNPDARLLQIRDYQGQGGRYIPSERRIEIGASRSTSPLEFKSTGLHELQHATQGAEGFARGGTPEMFTDWNIDALRAENKRHADRFKHLVRQESDKKGLSLSEAYNSIKDTDEMQMIATNLEKLQGAIKEYENPYRHYQRLAGEAEARQVQARMDMTPAERAANPFYADYDVPEADQIVRYGDSPSAMVAYHKADRPTLEEFTRSQRPSKKIKHGSMAQALRKEIKAKRDARRDLKYSNRDRLSPNIDQRLQWHKDSKQKAAAAEKIENRIESAGGLWNARFSNEIREASNYSLGARGLSREVREAISRANMEAVPRQLKKLGWSMRHSSAGRGGRKSSRYILSPDKKYEVRLSDHYLPDTPQRADTIARGGHGWTDEIVLDGDESPQELIDAIQRAARSDGSWSAADVLGGYADESVDDLARRAKVLKRNDKPIGGLLGAGN
jgi:hypothetical protein